MQVLQVKKVKKQLHDIIMKEEPINLPKRVPSFVPAAPPTGNRMPSRVNPSPLVTSRSNVAPMESITADTKPGVLSEDVGNTVIIPDVKMEGDALSNEINEETEVKAKKSAVSEEEKDSGN